MYPDWIWQIEAEDVGEEGGDHSVLEDVDEVGDGKLLVPKAKWRMEEEA